MKSFPFLMTYIKICPWSASYTPVMLHSHWHYWSSSLHKGYPWYKFESHTIFWSWDTSEGGGGGWGVYPPTPYFPCSLYLCMLTIVAKRCTFKNLFRSCLPSYVVVLPCNFTEGNILYYMFCIFSFASKFWNTNVDITRMYLNASLEWLSPWGSWTPSIKRGHRVFLSYMF